MPDRSRFPSPRHDSAPRAAAAVPVSPSLAGVFPMPNAALSRYSRSRSPSVNFSVNAGANASPPSGAPFAPGALALVVAVAVAVALAALTSACSGADDAAVAATGTTAADDAADDATDDATDDAADHVADHITGAGPRFGYPSRRDALAAEWPDSTFTLTHEQDDQMIVSEQRADGTRRNWDVLVYSYPAQVADVRRKAERVVGGQQTRKGIVLAEPGLGPLAWWAGRAMWVVVSDTEAWRLSVVDPEALGNLNALLDGDVGQGWRADAARVLQRLLARRSS